MHLPTKKEILIPIKKKKTYVQNKNALQPIGQQVELHNIRILL